jgi:hypothetical protein
VLALEAREPDRENGGRGIGRPSGTGMFYRIQYNCSPSSRSGLGGRFGGAQAAGMQEGKGRAVKNRRKHDRPVCLQIRGGAGKGSDFVLKAGL